MGRGNNVFITPNLYCCPSVWCIKMLCDSINVTIVQAIVCSFSVSFSNRSNHRCRSHFFNNRNLRSLNHCWSCWFYHRLYRYSSNRLFWCHNGWFLCNNWSWSNRGSLNNRDYRSSNGCRLLSTGSEDTVPFQTATKVHVQCFKDLLRIGPVAAHILQIVLL